MRITGVADDESFMHTERRTRRKGDAEGKPKRDKGDAEGRPKRDKGDAEGNRNAKRGMAESVRNQLKAFQVAVVAPIRVGIFLRDARIGAVILTGDGAVIAAGSVIAAIAAVPRRRGAFSAVVRRGYGHIIPARKEKQGEQHKKQQSQNTPLPLDAKSATFHSILPKDGIEPSAFQIYYGVYQVFCQVVCQRGGDRSESEFADRKCRGGGILHTFYVQTTRNEPKIHVKLK